MDWERERRFRQAFLPAYRSPFGIQRIGQSWITVKHPKRYLTDSMVAKHLRGDYYVGASGRVFTKTLTVDVDAHDERSEGDMLDRTRKAIDAFPDASPLVTTTPRNGTHVTWMLPEAVWSDRARAYARSQLAKSGLQVKPGRVEVYPHGRKIQRMPLGRSCLMLENDALEPVGDRRASIDAVDWLLKHDKTDRLVIPERFNPTLERGRSGKIRNQRTQVVIAVLFQTADHIADDRAINTEHFLWCRRPSISANASYW